MTCNRCGKEMTKEKRGEKFNWWCPFCGNTEEIKTLPNS